MSGVSATLPWQLLIVWGNTDHKDAGSSVASCAIPRLVGPHGTSLGLVTTARCFWDVLYAHEVSHQSDVQVHGLGLGFRVTE